MPTAFGEPTAFGPYLPDAADLGNKGTRFVNNVIPIPGGYGPFKSTQDFSDNGLNDRVRGAVTFKDDVGNVFNFAGTPSKLYKLAGSSWSDVTRIAPGDYSGAATSRWSFVDWSKDLLIATNGADAMQKIDPTGGANFEALGGTPPMAKVISIVANFLVAGNLSTDQNAIQWSGLDDPEEWTQGTKESDTQTVPGGGRVTGVIGGQTGFVMKERAIYAMIRDTVPFAFDLSQPVSQEVGALWHSTIAQLGDVTFFLSHQGFVAMRRGSLEFIGAGKVDRAFFKKLNAGFVENISVAIDPLNQIVMWACPSNDSADGLPDFVIMYNWQLREWGMGEIDLDLIRSSFTPGVTLEQLDSIGNIDALGISLDSRVWTGGALVMGAFTRAHKLGFFTGAALQAELDTTLINIGGGRRHFISGVRPLADTTAAEARVSTRERLGDAMVDGAYSAQDSAGVCPQDVSGRYSKVRMRIPAGSTWSETQGVEIDMGDDGED